MTVFCSRCRLPFDTVHSAAQHAWKSQDGDHDDVESLDEAIMEIASDGNPYGKSPDGSEEDLPSNTVTDTVNRTVNDEPSVTVNHGTGEDGADTVEEVATDGGNPAFGAPDPVPVTDGGDPDDEPTCVECGGNVFFDASEHTDYEYGCPHCSDEDGWVVWNG